MVGWLNNMFADTSRPTSFLVSLSTVMAIIESRPSSGNGASRLIDDGDILSSRPRMACNRVFSSVSRSSVDSVDQSGGASTAAGGACPARRGRLPNAGLDGRGLDLRRDSLEVGQLAELRGRRDRPVEP